MSGLALVGLYATIGTLVMFLAALFGIGKCDDDIPPAVIGLFWPLAAFILIVAGVFGAFYQVVRLGHYLHDLTDEAQP